MLAEILSHLFYDAEQSGKEYGSLVVTEEVLADPKSLISQAVAVLGYKPDLITRLGEEIQRQLSEGKSAQN